MHAAAATLDDLMQKVFRALLRSKERIRPSKGDAVEIRGALFRLSNPRARLSSTETKGTIFSCLGELLWYLGGRNDVESISYYLRRYEDSAESDGTVHGAYGPRLFGLRGINQIDNVIGILGRDDSRQAVIQLFSAEDINAKYKDVPCTCTLQFFRRGGKLDLMASMRSNDAFIGLPHDIFAFTMLQEIVAAFCPEAPRIPLPRRHGIMVPQSKADIALKSMERASRNICGMTIKAVRKV